MSVHVIPEGTGEPQDFQLRNDGSALVGTGLTVSLEIAAYSGAAVVSPPSVAWLDQAAGTVRVTGTELLPRDSYAVRYKLEDVAGAIGFVPNAAAPDVWQVVRVTR
ncbi:MAG: hypothetical protein AB7O32_00590 [Vicinamibacterales bacterium]